MPATDPAIPVLNYGHGRYGELQFWPIWKPANLLALGVGTMTGVFLLIGGDVKSLGAIAGGMLLYALFLPVALVILLLQWVRLQFIPTTSRYLLPVLLMLIFYPSFHFASCKFVGAAYHDLSYYRRVSPLQFLGLWVALNILLAVAIHFDKGPAYGTLARDWFIAGCGLVVLAMTEMMGLDFIHEVAVGGYGFPSEIHLLAIAGITSAVFSVILTPFDPLRNRER